MLGTYRRVFGTRAIILPFLAMFVGCLSIGMPELAILLLVHSRTGSLGAAGIIAGLYSAGNAVGLVVQGRLIDRIGQTMVLVPAAVICGTALSILALAADSVVTIGVCAVIGGLGLPAMITAMRALIPQILLDERDRTIAYAILAVTFSVAGLLGALVASGLLAVFGPAGAILTAAGFACAGGLTFAATRASRRWKPATRQPHGPLFSPGVRTLVASNIGLGFCAGLTVVGIPAIALRHGDTSLAPLLFAVGSIGDLAGGFGYGSREWPMARIRQLVLALLAAAALTFCVAGAVGQLAVLFPIMLLSGAAGAPAGIATSSLLDDVARHDALAQTYAVIVCAGLLSGSAGAAVGGAIADAVGPRLLFVAAGVGLTAVAGWTVLRRKTLQRRQILTFG